MTATELICEKRHDYKLYDRREERVSLDEIERIGI